MRLKDVIFKDSIVYGVTMNLSIVSAILLTPQYTRILTMGDYGIMDIFNTWNGLITNFLPMGMLTIIFIIYNDFKTKEEKRDSLGTIFVYLIFVSIFFSALSFLGRASFLDVIIGKKSDKESEIFFENIFIIIGTMMFTFILTILRAKFSKYQYVLVSLIQFLILSVLGYVLVCLVKTGLVGFYRASCLSFLISCLVGFYLIKEELFLSFSKSKFKELFKVSVHFLSVMMLMKLIEVFGRYLLKEYSSIEDIGIYSIAIRISSIIMFVLTSFVTAWYPYSMTIRHDVDRDKKVNKTHQIFYIVCSIMSVFILFFRSELIFFFAPMYIKAYHVIPILILSNIASTTIYFYQLGVNYTRQIKFISLGGLCSVIVTGVFSFILIKNYGALGYASATLLGMLTWVGTQHYFAQKLEFVNFSYNVLFLFLGTYLVACIIPFFADNTLMVMPLAKRIMCKTAISIAVLIPIGIYGYWKFKEDLSKLFRKKAAIIE